MISVSLMCANMLDLNKDLKEFEKGKVDYLHIDIMDGNFVPNYTMGTDLIKTLHLNTNIPLDIHLMVDKPELKIEFFEIEKSDLVTFHVEATSHVDYLIKKIKERGARCGIAINPGTSLDTVKYILSEVDVILIMTVNPGFAGQKLIPYTLDKISDVRSLIEKMELSEVKIEVDGNVSFENAKVMRLSGADVFVAGSSSVFKKDLSISEGLALLRKQISYL